MTDADEDGGRGSDDRASQLMETFFAWEEGLPAGISCATTLEKWSPDTVKLDNLYIPEEFRHMGWGPKIMKALISFADSHQVTLVLDPAWLGEGPAPYDLSVWYAKYGFVVGNMIRHPQVNQPD